MLYNFIDLRENFLASLLIGDDVAIGTFFFFLTFIPIAVPFDPRLHEIFFNISLKIYTCIVLFLFFYFF